MNFVFHAVSIEATFILIWNPVVSGKEMHFLWTSFHSRDVFILHMRELNQIGSNGKTNKIVDRYALELHADIESKIRMQRKITKPAILKLNFLLNYLFIDI